MQAVKQEPVQLCSWPVRFSGMRERGMCLQDSYCSSK